MTDGSNIGQVLKAVLERIEYLDEEIKGLNEGKRDIYKEAKSNGLDVKALKHLISLRRQDPGERSERETIVDLYKQAIGMP